MNEKILLLSYRDLRHPEMGGAEIIIHEVYRRLHAAGHEVTFLTCRFPGGAERDPSTAWRSSASGICTTSTSPSGRTTGEHLRRPRLHRHRGGPEQAPVLRSRLPARGAGPGQHPAPLRHDRLLAGRLSPGALCLAAGAVRARGLPRERVPGPLRLHARRPPRGAAFPPSGSTSSAAASTTTTTGPPAGRARPAARGRSSSTWGGSRSTSASSTRSGCCPRLRERVPGTEYWIVGEGDYRADLERIAREAGVRGRGALLRVQGGGGEAGSPAPEPGAPLHLAQGGVGALGHRGQRHRAPVRGQQFSRAARVGAGRRDRLPRSARRPRRRCTTGSCRCSTDDALWRRFSAAGLVWAARFHWDTMAEETLALIRRVTARGRK